MTSKIARNEPCPCGSGKKYKFCHGNPADSGESGVRAVEMQYRFDSIILSPETRGDEKRIAVNGELSAGPDERYPFLMIVRPLPDGGMQIQQFGWQRIPPIADKDAVARQLLRYLGECLEVLAVHAQPGEGDSGGIAWQPVREAAEIDSAHCVVLRPRLGRLPGPDWSTLWDRISLKLSGDPAFNVKGFSAEQVERALARLRDIYTPGWLEGVFRAAAGVGEGADMNTELPHEATASWFPAFQLSQLANGVICRDPALNTLVDLGLALEELEGFTGLDALRTRLADRPQLHHQACLAAEFFRRGCLSAFHDGHGDLKVILDDQSYLVRSVEVRHDSLLDDLRAAMAEAGDEGLPVILHAVVCESSWYQPGREPALEEAELALPAHVFALAVGHRFLDAEGGRLKRRVSRVIYNEGGVDMPADRSVERLLAPNHESWQAPALNVGSYFYVV